MLALATLAAAGSLGLARPPYVGVACRTPNATACGRIGVAVWLDRPAYRVDVVVLGQWAPLRRARGADAWTGFVHVDPTRLRLPARWYGTRPTRILVLRLTVRCPGRTARGARGTILRPGWG